MHLGNSSSIVGQSLHFQICVLTRRFLANIWFLISLYQKALFLSWISTIALQGSLFSNKDSEFQPLALWTICRPTRMWVPGCRSVSYVLLAEGHKETGFLFLPSSVGDPAYVSEDQARRPEGHSGLRKVQAVQEQSEQSCRTLARLQWQFPIGQLSYFEHWGNI